MISVAMATYNGAKYIQEQIDSILNQTIQDFELIVSDDCSNDNTLLILKEYERRDSRIKVFENEKNLGFVRNFECVINKCRGEFVALSDQDDIWFPDHLEMLLKAMDGDSQLVCGKSKFVDENNIELPSKCDYLEKKRVPSNNEDMARHIFLGHSTFQGASMLIRRSFFEKALPVPDGVLYHDSWFAALSCFTGGLVYVDKYTMRYRRYSNSITIESRYKSPFRLFVASLLFNHALKDRLIIVKNIREHEKTLSHKQQKLLMVFEKLLVRRRSALGRLLNVPYYIRHFRAIYATGWMCLFK